ncbi:MAG: N-6 DNA methylase [Armatimonadetes bacterium]|nr:N-6 DNA methylase [Armatimonadota bacterium]
MQVSLPPMTDYAEYVASLEQKVNRTLGIEKFIVEQSELLTVLNGEPSRQLRRLVKIDARRASGAFFTDSQLRDRALEHIGRTIDARSIILDPACGAGDLLIAASNYLPVCNNNLADTLDLWGTVLNGYDIHPEFIRTTKARLVLAAVKRMKSSHYIVDSIDPRCLFSNIQVRDSLDGHSFHCKPTHIVVNPPYSSIDAAADCKWGGGKVSVAGVFLDVCLRSAKDDTVVCAILPDVLRSGSRYKKWREQVESSAKISAVDIVGQFDIWTDVDVFVLHLQVDSTNARGSRSAWGQPETKEDNCVDDLFEVCVGAVIPHRHAHTGPWRRYICARQLSGLTEYDTDTAKSRRFQGRVFRPPFVVVRRTTRPSDCARVFGTVITGEQPVAVENHLIVLSPKDGTHETCARLIDVVQNPKATTWLNQRIRCRHYTVLALRELPWCE